MLVPLRWLSEFVDHGMSPEDLAHALTMGGLEVDAVIRRFPWAGKVVTTKVLAVEPHPNADKLRLAKVVTPEGEESIVCGAPNLYEGMVTALALMGCDLGEGMVVKKAKIRGVESRGMLCSARELGMSEDHSGILDLDQSLEPGLDLAQALSLEDTVLEVAITPNRGDALSMLGVARDVAAITGKPLTTPPIDLTETDPGIQEACTITVADEKGCPRYAARFIRDVKIAPSPMWMADRLMACGVRPISNVVDVTNYVLLERGQPLHAFDYATLAGQRIHVRAATEGERFITLDNQERVLQEGMLLICDGERPVGLAGVMGGLNSEITDDTTDVLIEAAFFDPINTRRTSKRLGLSTEASYRFERGVDVSGCADAASRAAQLIEMLADGKVASGVIDVYPTPHQPPRLPLSISRTATYLGVPLELQQVVELLERLDIKIEPGGDEDSIVAIPPAARTDLERPVDLTEEVARLVGYNSIPVHLPKSKLSAPARAWRQVVREKSRGLMTAQGCDEALSLSFAHPAASDWLRLAEDDDRRRVVKLMNPLSEDQSVLRTTLLPGLLTSVRRNLSFSVADVALFEVGKVFWEQKEGSLPEEPERLAGALAGLAQPVSWHAGEKTVSLAHAKGAVSYLVEGLGITGLDFAYPDQTPGYFQPGVWCQVMADDTVIGEVGRVNAKVAAQWDISQAVYAFELDFDHLVRLAPAGKAYRHLDRFPAVVRDVALVVDEAVGAGEVLSAARQPQAKKAARWLDKVEMFDLYRGKPLAGGQKSLALRFHYRAGDRTLTEDEVLPAHQKVVDQLLEQFSGSLRQ